MKRFVLTSLFILIAGSSVSQAGYVVEMGHDLFRTDTAYLNLGSGPIPFEGVPLGTFDWSGTTWDNEDLGNTDTIIERKGAAVTGGSGETAPPIPIELVALQLVSVDPIDVGAGLGFHYATLQAGTPSTGTMDITFDDELGGSFASFFDVFFDLRIGALDGPILFSGFKTFTSTGVAWAREPTDPDAIKLDGINYLLDGGTISEDFWPPVGVHDAGDGSQHIVSTATPEPTTICLLGLGGLLLSRRKRA